MQFQINPHENGVISTENESDTWHFREPTILVSLHFSTISAFPNGHSIMLQKRNYKSAINFTTLTLLITQCNYSPNECASTFSSISQNFIQIKCIYNIVWTMSNDSDTLTRIALTCNLWFICWLNVALVYLFPFKLCTHSQKQTNKMLFINMKAILWANELVFAI